MLRCQRSPWCRGLHGLLRGLGNDNLTDNDDNSKAAFTTFHATARYDDAWGGLEQVKVFIMDGNIA
jgi:hypothetical protein